jgi:hypothetical protein
MVAATGDVITTFKDLQLVRAPEEPVGQSGTVHMRSIFRTREMQAEMAVLPAPMQVVVEAAEQEELEMLVLVRQEEPAVLVFNLIFPQLVVSSMAEAALVADILLRLRVD